MTIDEQLSTRAYLRQAFCNSERLLYLDSLDEAITRFEVYLKAREKTVVFSLICGLISWFPEPYLPEQVASYYLRSYSYGCRSS